MARENSGNPRSSEHSATDIEPRLIYNREMISGISIFCFAASYAVALVLEITRLWFRSAARGAVKFGFVFAGLIAHTIFLAHRAYQDQLQHQAPLSNSSAYFLLTAWFLVVLFLYIHWTQPRVASGIFLLPLILLFVGAGKLASTVPFSNDVAATTWVYIHVVFFMLGYVVVVFGFVVGVMYLIQASRLKRKLPPIQRFQLPALEWLERANQRATVLAAILVSIGLCGGIIWNTIKQGVIPWTDPVILRSAGMMAWLIAAGLFSGLYMPAQRGRKVAYLTVASFVFLVASLVIRFAFNSQHSTQVNENTKSTVSISFQNYIDRLDRQQNLKREVQL